MSKVTMPDYTLVGYVAKHNEVRNQVDGKIHSAGVPLSRTGGTRKTYMPPGEGDNHSQGQKIRGAGIPYSRETGGTVCGVPKGIHNVTKTPRKI